MFKLTDFNFKDKRVLVRSSLNVCFNGKKIEDDFRLKSSVPTIKYLLSKGALVCICGHIGRPKPGELSTKLIKTRLEKLLSCKITFISDIKNLKDVKNKNKVYLLENLRHFKGEINSSSTFAKRVTKHFDYFVQDSYDTIHRDQASITKFCRFLPSCAGKLLESELHYFEKFDKCKKPLSIILGGIKKEKVEVLKKMTKMADNILTAGVLANTILYKKDFDIKESKIADLSLLKGININNPKIINPIDLAYVKFDGKESAIDIGKQTIDFYISKLKKSKTILWIGPTGLFEKYPKNMNLFAKKVSQLNAVKIIGGGDTTTAIINFGLEDKMNHVSTGGGSTLDLLKGAKMPGIESLKTNYKIYNQKTKIFPTVFSTNKKIFDTKFDLLNNNFKNIQIDFMDGRFVAGKSVEISYVPKLTKSKTEYEAHLMNKNPLKLVSKIKEKGFKRFIFHFEACKKDEIEKIVLECHKKKLKPILAINPTTKYEEFREYLHLFKQIMFMGVIPGKEGQKLISSVIELIRKTKYTHSQLIIQVDGGVNLKTAASLSDAGASILNSGSFISSSDSPKVKHRLLVEEANKNKFDRKKNSKVK